MGFINPPFFHGLYLLGSEVTLGCAFWMCPDLPGLPGSQNVERPLPPDPTPSRALPTW